MNKSVAIALSLVVVFGAFYKSLLPNLSPQSAQTPALSLSLPDFKTLTFTNLADQAVAIAAWDTFQKYREYMRTHDLEGVKSLSHQLSATCQDPLKRAECENLMDSAYFFTQDFKQEDFKYVYADQKQIILLTEALVLEGESELIQTALLFTRDEAGQAKVLGAKFCIGKAKVENKCVETEPSLRDRDNNGWWDDIEAQFK